MLEARSCSSDQEVREIGDIVGAAGEPRFTCASFDIQLYKKEHAELVCDSWQGPGTA